jgi:hypothetical protein
LIRTIQERITGSELTRTIEHVLLHDSLPVDIRHNAKIFREQLAVWATDQLREAR